MIGMTGKARKKAGELLATAGKDAAALRIDVQGDPCSPSYGFSLVDAPGEGDYLIEEGGIRVCFDPRRARSLFNIEIDHDGSAGTGGFSARRTAPCG